uniref:Putative secreted protein n=1 Tax=Anopheles darlingi TaxID=43151 RepID=A0A2M4DH91_ANODA
MPTGPLGPVCVCVCVSGCVHTTRSGMFHTPGVYWDVRRLLQCYQGGNTVVVVTDRPTDTPNRRHPYVAHGKPPSPYPLPAPLRVATAVAAAVGQWKYFVRIRFPRYTTTAATSHTRHWFACLLQHET